MKRRLSYCVFTYLILLLSCNADQAELHGSLVGFVQLTDENGNTIQQNELEVTVRLEGTTYYTAANRGGRFNFQGIPVGTYNVIVEKPGYGTKKHFSALITPGPKPAFIEEPITLFETPGFLITEMQISQDSSSVSVHLNSTPLISYDVQILFSTDPQIGLDAYAHKSVFGYCCFSEPASNFVLTIPRSAFSGMNSQEFYMVIYAKNRYETPFLDPAQPKELNFSSWKQLTDVTPVVLK